MRLSTRCLFALSALFVAPRISDAAPGCTVPGFNFAAFGDTGIDMQNGNTDSWNSANGTYAQTSCPANSSCIGGVGTNATGTGSVSLGPNGSVRGTCTTGYGGSTADISGSSNCSSTGVAGSSVSLSSVTAPVLPAGSGTSGTLAPGHTYGAISGNTTLSAGSYVMSSISESGQGALDVSSGPVIVYLTGPGQAISISGQGKLNNTTATPSNLVFMCTDSVTSLDVTGNGTGYYAVYCPKADITVKGNGAIYGAVVGKSVSFSGNNGTIHYDSALSTYTSGAITCGTTEISRASPIIASITTGTTNAAGAVCSAGQTSCNAIVQGTFTPGSGTKTSLSTHATVSAWTFPYLTGHMRAREASTVTSTASTFSASTPLFDANGSIPAPNYTTCGTPVSGTCRYIFTNTNTDPSTGGTTFRPAIAAFNDANATTIGQKIAPSTTYTDFGTYASDYQTVIHKILSASLGGVDRSTVAVIGASGVTTSPNRPTIAYFGAADGMLHAVCASTGGTTASQATSVCPSLGKELWAFMPRQQLPLVRTNDQRIDGSVHVVDSFGDFTSGQTGAKSWHTILTFQTGYADSTVAGAKPAAFGIDVTDPATPVLLWEYTTPTTAAATDFGTGLVATVGPTLVNGIQKNLAILETNNGGTGTAGVVATAVNVENGATVWTAPFTYTYPTAAAVPANGVPGGGVGVDLTGNGFITDVVMGDLYGDLWRLNASTGASQNGTGTPLVKLTYAASSDKHPIGGLPAIYSDGNNIYAAFESGGYADQKDGTTAWSAGTQYLLAVKLKATSAPVSETGTASNSATGDLRLKQSFSSGYRGYSQPTVVGNQLFATADSADVNSATYGQAGTASGQVIAFNAISTTASETTYNSGSGVYAGGSSIVAGTDTSGATILYAGSADKQVQAGKASITNGGAGVGASSSSTGLGTATSVDLTNAAKIVRNLWLRTM